MTNSKFQQKTTGIATEQNRIGEIFKFLITIISFAGLYLLFVSLFSRNIGDNDFWGYLSFGRVFWEKGFFPLRDIFSYTPTKTIWIYHEWMTGVIFYFILKHAGPAGIQLLQYIVIVLTLSLIYATAIKKGASSVFAFIALMPAMLLMSFGYVPVRAQIFTYLFFILTIYILETARISQKGKVLFWLLPVFILWCNLHGGFVAGLGVIALYALGEGISGRKTAPFIAIFFLAGLGTLANPYGIEYWRFLTDSLTMSRPEIGEWFSVSTALKRHYQTVPVIIFIILYFLSLLLFLLQKRRNATDMIVTAVIIYLGVAHVRHTIFLGVLFGAFMPVILSDLWKSLVMKTGTSVERSRWLPGTVSVILFLSIYFFSNPSITCHAQPHFFISADQSRYPVGAMEYMHANHFRGKILSDFDWGEYIIWEGHPDLKVAMDGRYETVYDKNICGEYFDFLTGRREWNHFLKKYPPDFVLIKPHTLTHNLLLKDPGWQTAYTDQWSVLLIRK